MAAAKANNDVSVNVVESGPRLVIIVLGIMAASLMQTLDGTITNVALPNIQGNLGVSQDAATWVVTGYTVAALIVIPITPWLQNRFGRKNYYVASITGFTIASVLCGLSDQLALLVFWRVVQGAFGGGLLAVGQSVLRDSFPPEKLGASQGIFAIGVVMGPALGPPLGGLIVDNFTWNLVFYINIVPGLIATAIMLVLLRDPRKPQKAPLDFVGLGLLVAFVGSLQYVLTEGEQDYWFADPIITTLAIVSLLSLGAFIFWELRGTDKPVVDLRVLSNRSISAGALLAFALGAALYGTSYTLPQYTQGPLGFTPTLSGELFIIRALPIALATPLIVRLIAKFDARIFLGIGFLLIGIGSVAQANETTLISDFWTFGLALLCLGAGTAFLFTPLTIAVLGGTSPENGPKASAFINLGIQLGGSIAVAALAVVLDHQQTVHASALRSQATLANVNVQMFLRHGSLIQLSQFVNGQALIQAYADATVVIGLVAFACIPLIFLMKKPAKHKGPAEMAGG
jgi:DHA2 family multidrug resistance protein